MQEYHPDTTQTSRLKQQWCEDGTAVQMGCGVPLTAEDLQLENRQTAGSGWQPEPARTKQWGEDSTAAQAGCGMLSTAEEMLLETSRCSISLHPATQHIDQPS